MFKFSVADPTALKELITLIRRHTKRSPTKNKPRKHHIQMMDASRVAMLNMEIPKTFFEEYNVPEPTTLTVNIPEL
jgi:DNA polymerase III sliding clamp (beta) subunit (PCNA family)